MSEKKTSIKKNISLPIADGTAVPCKGVCIIVDPGNTDTLDVSLNVSSVEMDFNTNQGSSILPITIQFDTTGDEPITMSQCSDICYPSTFPYSYKDEDGKITKTVTFYRYLLYYGNKSTAAKVVERDVTATSVSWTKQELQTVKGGQQRDSVKIGE